MISRRLSCPMDCIRSRNINSRVVNIAKRLWVRWDMVMKTARSLVSARSTTYMVRAVSRQPIIIINELLFKGFIRLKKTMSAARSGITTLIAG